MESRAGTGGDVVHAHASAHVTPRLVITGPRTLAIETEASTSTRDALQLIEVPLRGFTAEEAIGMPT